MRAVTGHVVAGRYELLSLVGQGAMGTVWRANDPVLGREVAVKEIRLPGLMSEQERRVLRERTLREARVAAKLSHPGVVTVHDVIQAGGNPWIVMEYVPARSLQRTIDEDGPLDAPRAAAIGAMLLDALASAHAAGIVHRDVKPANVLITADGRAVLTDFGIATLEGEPGLTQAGMVMGTPGYCAPERIRGEPASAASDLWSLGATLYAAVEGQAPFHRGTGESPMAVLAMIVNSEPPAATAAGSLSPVIGALMRRDPRSRPNAAEAARMLAQARAVPPSPVTGPPATGVAAVAAVGAGAGRLRPDRTRGDRAQALPPRDAKTARGPGVDGRPGGAAVITQTAPQPVIPARPGGDRRASAPTPAAHTRSGWAPGASQANRPWQRTPVRVAVGVGALLIGLLAAGLIIHAARGGRLRSGAARTGRASQARPLPAGYRWYTAPPGAAGVGLSLAVPQGWAVARHGVATVIRDSVTSATITVSPAFTGPGGAPGGPAFPGQAQWEAFPGYHAIAAGTLPLRGSLARTLRFRYRLPDLGQMEGIAVMTHWPANIGPAGYEFVATSPLADWVGTRVVLAEALRTFAG